MVYDSASLSGSLSGVWRVKGEVIGQRGGGIKVAGRRGSAAKGL